MYLIALNLMPQGGTAYIAKKSVRHNRARTHVFIAVFSGMYFHFSVSHVYKH